MVTKIYPLLQNDTERTLPTEEAIIIPDLRDDLEMKIKEIFIWALEKAVVPKITTRTK